MGLVQKWLQVANGLFNVNTGAQAVELVDDAGNPVGSANPLPTVASVTVNAVGIKNVAGGQVNPSTSDKQPALGTAGAPSADVLTVQGAPGMTAVMVDGSGVTQPVSAAALPLPAGAATAANQATASSSLATIATNTTGVATAANQSTANTSLAGIKTDLDSLSGAGLTLANIAVSQGAAGITVLQAASAGKVARLHAIAITVDTDATVVQIVQDDDGAGTNAVVLATWKLNSYGGIVLPAQLVAAAAWAATAAGKCLTMVTTTGKAFGVAKVSQA